MTKASNGKIGSREIVSMIMTMLVMKATDTTPTLIAKTAENAAWMVPLISALLTIGPLLIMLSLLKKYKNKGIMDIIFHLTGKYIGFIIGMIFFWIFFSSLVINSRSYIAIMSDMFFISTPILILYLFLIVSIWYVASRGLEVIGRTAWLFLPLFQAVAVLLFFIAQKDIDFKYMFPIFGGGIGKILKQSVLGVSIYGDIFYLPIIFHSTTNYGDFKKANLLGFLISVLELTGVMYAFIIFFDYPPMAYLNYPFQEFTRSVHFGEYFSNPEAFFFIFWVMAAVIRFSIYLYLTTVTFGYTLKIREFEPLVLTFAALTLVFGLIPENEIKDIFSYRRFLLSVIWPFFMFLPPVLWIISRIRGDKGNEIT